MPKTIHHFRTLLAEKKPEDTLVELQGWLAAGDRTFMKQLASLKRSQGKSHLLGDLNRLIDLIEQESPQLHQFLYYYHSANEAYEEGQWELAVSHLVAAIELHQPEYLALRKDLERKLTATHSHLQMETLVRQGNDAYLTQNWSRALESFTQAKRLYDPSCPWQIEEFDQVIETCKKGEVFSHHLQQAQAAKSTKDWSLAITNYKEAIKLHEEAFRVNITSLGEEMGWCQLQLEEEDREKASTFAARFSGRKFLLPLLLSGVAVLLIGLVFAFHSSGNAATKPFIATSLENSEKLATSETDFAEAQRMSFAEEADEQLTVESSDYPANVLAETTLASPPNSVVSSVASILAVPSPDASFSLQGELVVGKSFVLSIPAYDPSVAYKMDFGNGVVMPVKQGHRYSYPSAGSFQVKLLAKRPGAQEAMTSRMINIANNEPVVIADPKIESAPIDPIASLAPARPETVYLPAPSPIQEVAPAPAPKPAAPAPITSPLEMAQRMPFFPGGDHAMLTYLQSKLQYPPLAKEREVSGTVYVRFVVEADGHLTGFQVLRGLGYGCDEEALRIVRSMPTWHAGQQQGVAVPVYYTLPVKFEMP